MKAVANLRLDERWWFGQVHISGSMEKILTIRYINKVVITGFAYSLDVKESGTKGYSIILSWVARRMESPLRWEYYGKPVVWNTMQNKNSIWKSWLWQEEDMFVPIIYFWETNESIT